jgi:hypothetical protein
VTPEQQRLTEHQEQTANWKLWGPYLAERAWGTVREDYTPDGIGWKALPHDQARSRAYRWNEDGLAGISDRGQYLCLALALWNGNDPILKERLFGLDPDEGNHGEDVKEAYFYVDNTPTHSFMRMRYLYPHAYPYSELVEENGRRTRSDPEFEIYDTGAFVDGRYFDVEVVYAKAAEADLLMQVRVVNRGSAPAECVVAPSLWFRNTWSWGYEAGPMGDVPVPPVLAEDQGFVTADHAVLGRYRLYVEAGSELIFTENETASDNGYAKDAFHRYVINGEVDAVNPAGTGTKVAALHRARLEPGEEWTVRVRLTTEDNADPFGDFDAVVDARRIEADEFYDTISPDHLSNEERRTFRQALAGMLWNKQFYYYDVEQWLDGDPAGPISDPKRRQGRNAAWAHVNTFDILSMPDSWEFPWFAAWDLAFHCVPLAIVDPEFAKRQLLLIAREWFMHPNGQLPAYEWEFGDVNPPVHAWGAWRVYEVDGDRDFLERIFHKLLLNFTWWVNRKDADGNNVFQGGFLGLDNISVFDRSVDLPYGGHIDQSDGTAWMGFYSLGMMRIALELARENPAYEDTATKFFEHFLGIARAMTADDLGHGLWDPDDGFFYDVVHLPDGSSRRLGVRSLVGLIPLLAVEVLDGDVLADLPDFDRRLHWFLRNRPHLSGNMASIDESGQGARHIAAFLTRERLVSVLRYLLDPNEFLSPHGIRSLSKVHEGDPFQIEVDESSFSVGYEPAEATSDLYGGNSNWRGPVWFPINCLIIEALRKFHTYYGDDLRVEMPTGSGIEMNLAEVADDIAQRLVSIFMPDGAGQRPVHGGREEFSREWDDMVLFYEYFHGDTGAGLGASHQTGWTGLVATMLRDRRDR